MESVSSHSSIPQCEVSDFPIDKNAELEVQQWELVWTHVISMITQVIDCHDVTAETGLDKRAILIDLVSKLCESATQPKQNEEYANLKRKYEKCKASLKKLKAQSQTLLSEVQKNKSILETHLTEFQSKEQDALSSQIKQLEDLLKQQLEKQTEFLNYKPPSPAPKSPSRRKPIEEPKEDIQIPVDEDLYIPPVVHKSPPKPVVEEEDEEIPPIEMKRKESASVSDCDSVTFRKQAASKARSKMSFKEAEDEADEILSKSHRSRSSCAKQEVPKHHCRVKKNYKDHVNQLIDLTNRLRDDYKRLGEYGLLDGSAEEVSIDHLSRLNDTLVSAEHQISSVSE